MKINIAILGFGKIGSGVYEHLRDNADLIRKRLGESVVVKYALDAVTPPDFPANCYLTNDINNILEDTSVKTVVETMGGFEPAYSYVSACLTHGLTVVTSNKELVSKKGAELFKLAETNGCALMFEASVGGGIPVIAALNNYFLSDEITEISAILNGTTNYILSRMAEGGTSFEDALEEAQQKGFAEKDPSDDINGIDSARKIAILASIASGRRFEGGDIPTKGIADITQDDINYAKQMGASVKLNACYKRTDAGFEIFVAPVIVPGENPLSAVCGVTNCILITGGKMGQYRLLGPGAGKEPTSCAVVSDIISAALNKDKRFKSPWGFEAQELPPPENNVFVRFTRIKCDNADSVKNAALEISGECKFYKNPQNTGEIGILMPPLAMSVFYDRIAALLEKAGEASLVKSMRVI